MAVSFLLLFLPLHVWTAFLQTISQDNPLLSEVAVPSITVTKAASNTVYSGPEEAGAHFPPFTSEESRG